MKISRKKEIKAESKIKVALAHPAASRLSDNYLW
jgi:hypothetical protein